MATRATPSCGGSPRLGVGAGRLQRWLLLLLCATAGGAAAQTIAYTVQVVAVSDRQSALELIGDLDGFPAYFVRATTGVGEVYRVRVGAFSDRGAALRYAAELPPVGGIEPVPALAENIPTPLMPLQGGVVAAVDPQREGWELLPWRDGVALRSQPLGAPAEARYTLVRGGEALPFAAWRAAPQEDGTLLRVRDLPLWPTDWQAASEAVRDSSRASVAALVARQLGLAEEVVLAAEAPGPDGVPRLVVLERIRADAVDRVGRAGFADLIGLADAAAGLERSGPERWIVGGERVPEPIAALELPATTGEVEGDGWRASEDGVWLRLTELRNDPAGGAGASWRALVGSPRWARGELLLADHGSELLLYAIRDR